MVEMEAKFYLKLMEVAVQLRIENMMYIRLLVGGKEVKIGSFLEAIVRRTIQSTTIILL